MKPSGSTAGAIASKPIWIKMSAVCEVVMPAPQSMRGYVMPAKAGISIINHQLIVFFMIAFHIISHLLNPSLNISINKYRVFWRIAKFRLCSNHN